MIYKLKYVWFDGEEEEIHCIHPTRDLQADLIEIKNEINKDKTYFKDEIRCIPTFFNEIIKQLEKKGYILEHLIESKVYFVESSYDEECKISLREEKIIWQNL